MTRGSIVFIDDEEELCQAAEDWLGVSGFSVRSFTRPQDAMDEVDPDTVDCVVTDVRMPRVSGLDVLRHFRAVKTDLPVVLLTGHGDVALAVDAMRQGAHDFLQKPYDAEHLVVVLDRAVAQRRSLNELDRLRRGDGSETIEDRLVGQSASMAQLRRSVLHLANIDVDVLVTGETGTGKELVARALHDFGARSKHNFVAINCAAVPETVFESELFGHARGAFTGAAGERLGKLEHARGGTVFLDEIESMPLTLQAKVLRAIQERTVEPLGTNAVRPIDVRFVAASKVNLRDEIDAGRFRADLYFRLATVDIGIPPLRARRDDIALLLSRFTLAASKRYGVPRPHLAASELAHYRDGEWPGNVRELKAAAERRVLGLSDVPAPRSADASLSLPDQVARFEAGLIREALRHTNGSSADAAERLGIARRTLNEKIVRYGLREHAQ